MKREKEKREKREEGRKMERDRGRLSLEGWQSFSALSKHSLSSKPNLLQINGD